MRLCRPYPPSLWISAVDELCSDCGTCRTARSAHHATASITTHLVKIPTLSLGLVERYEKDVTTEITSYLGFSVLASGRRCVLFAGRELPGRMNARRKRS